MRECKGWCKSFTRTELGLSLLQALLFVVLIGFLVFLTLHLLVCSVRTERTERAKFIKETLPPEKTTSVQSLAPTLTSHTGPYLIDSSIFTHTTDVVRRTTVTLPPDVECTWQPSKKTKPPTHYYWTPPDFDTATIDSLQALEETNIIYSTKDIVTPLEVNDDDDSEASPDGDIASQRYRNYVAALVKLKPPSDVTFGCILTKVTPYWTLTAASCIESIEEVDSLDSFFIMDSYGEAKQGLSHALADVQIHPLYQGANRSYDLAALRSDDALTPSAVHLLQLPTMLDYFLVALGERFTILGYGGYRSVEVGPQGRRLRRVSAYTVSAAQCGGGADAWAPRHLARGRGGGALAPGACAAGALCAGALYSRGTPCAFCAGTPLLRAGRLLAVMSDNRQCGVACEPTLYVNVAALRDWLDSVLD